MSTSLQKTEKHLQSIISSISGTVADSVSGQAVMANIKIYVTSNKPGAPDGVLIDTMTTANGQFNVAVPSLENYLIVSTPVSPYAAKSAAIENLNVNGDSISSIVGGSLINFTTIKNIFSTL